MRIAFGCDHGGWQLKEELMAHARELGHEVTDKGCFDQQSCDYPDFGEAAARAVAAGEADRAVVVCTTGIGISIAANKVAGVRCAQCGGVWQAEMTRRHNDANALALGAGVTGPLLAKQILEKFLTTGFEGGRHQRRVDKIGAIRP